MLRPFTTTDGQGSGSFSSAYSGDVFLITMSCAPNSFSASRAASILDIQRLPMGSFTYRVIECFFMRLSSPFTWVSAFSRHRAAGRRGYIFFILFFKYFEEVGDEWFFQEVALESAVNEEIDDPIRAKQCQVLGDIRLADVEGVFKITHAFHALCEFFEDLDPDRMGNDFKEIDSFLCRDHTVAHSFRLERTAGLAAYLY